TGVSRASFSVFSFPAASCPAEGSAFFDEVFASFDFWLLADDFAVSAEAFSDFERGSAVSTTVSELFVGLFFDFAEALVVFAGAPVDSAAVAARLPVFPLLEDEGADFGAVSPCSSPSRALSPDFNEPGDRFDPDEPEP